MQFLKYLKSKCWDNQNWLARAMYTFVLSSFLCFCLFILSIVVFIVSLDPRVLIAVVVAGVCITGIVGLIFLSEEYTNYHRNKRGW